MSNIVGQGPLSIEKKNITGSTKESVYSARRMTFAHQCTGGESTIDLLNLVTPTTMAANGFLNPSAPELAAANLAVFKRNLRLYSSRLPGLRLFEFDSYICAGTTISLIGSIGTALPGEIFIGEVDMVQADATVLTDARYVTRTYTLAFGQTTLNLGETFVVNQNESEQVGALRVRRNGLSQLRNVSNATAGVSADGNYQEIDAGNGYGTSIVFNIGGSDPAGEAIEVDFGLHVAQADQQVFGTIELLYGALLKLAVDGAYNFYGDTDTSRYIAASPSAVERRGFGDLVLSLSDRTTALEGPFKYQKKPLSAALSATTADIASMRFSNLEIGKHYKLTLHAYLINVGVAIGQLDAVHNGNVIANRRSDNDVGGAQNTQASSVSVNFEATATTVTFNFTRTGSSTLQGNGTLAQTFAMLEELSRRVETNIW